MKPDSLQRASVFAAVTVLALVIALVPAGLPRWLTYALLVVAGVSFVPAVFTLVIWWTGVEGLQTRGRRRNALLAVLFTASLAVHVYNVFVLGLTQRWADEVQLFTIGALLVGIVQCAGRVFGRELWLGET